MAHAGARLRIHALQPTRRDYRGERAAVEGSLELHDRRAGGTRGGADCFWADALRRHAVAEPRIRARYGGQAALEVRPEAPTFLPGRRVLRCGESRCRLRWRPP